MQGKQSEQQKCFKRRLKANKEQKQSVSMVEKMSRQCLFNNQRPLVSLLKGQ